MIPARARAAARRAAAVVGAVACVGAVAVLATLPPADGTGTGTATGTASPGMPSRTVAVTPADSVLVCPSPLRLAQPDVGDDQFAASPVATSGGLVALAWGAGTAEVARLGAGTPPTPLAGGPDGSAVQEVLPDDAPVVRAEASGRAAAAVAGVAASVTTGGDLRGLATGPCATPGIEHWLVGGSTEVGSSARLVLQNPGGTPAKVHLEAWGPSGPVVIGSQAAIVVPPGEQVETLLEAVAPEQRRLALHLVATGGRVAAYVQHHSIDGIVPQGVDLVTPGAAPAVAVAVPGVVSAGEPVDDPHAPRLRVLAPGVEAGSAHVTVYGTDGPVRLRGAEDVELAPGQVTDVPLGGLPAGTYTVVVDASVPVVAVGTFARAGEADEEAVADDAPYDRAWAAGQAVVADPPVGVAAVVPDARSTVTLTALPAGQGAERGADGSADGVSEVVVRGLGADGAATGSVPLELAAGVTVTLPVTDLGAGTVGVRVETGGPDSSVAGVAWSVVVVADDGTGTPGTLVSVLAPTPVAPVASAVEVRRVDATG